MSNVGFARVAAWVVAEARLRMAMDRMVFFIMFVLLCCCNVSCCPVDSDVPGTDVRLAGCLKVC